MMRMQGRRTEPSVWKAGRSRGKRSGVSFAGAAALGWLAARRRGMAAAAAAAGGGYLLYNGIRRLDGGAEPAKPVMVRRSMTVNRPRDEVFAFWADVESLPTFMRHLADVEQIDERRSRWVFDVPGVHRRLEWYAETTDRIENERLAWRSIPGGDVENQGEVVFRDAPGGGTEVHVRISYRAPAGELGRLAARALNPGFSRIVREDIRRAKHILEAGELPVSQGPPPRGLASTRDDELAIGEASARDDVLAIGEASARDDELVTGEASAHVDTSSSNSPSDPHVTSGGERTDRRDAITSKQKATD